MSEWQPIETAPKKLAWNEYILGSDGSRSFAMEWVEDDNCWADVWDRIDGEYHERFPTHWMPLPDPPQ